MARGTRYDSKLKEQIRWDYINSYTTARKLGKKYHIPYRTIEEWCYQGKWRSLRNIPDETEAEFASALIELKNSSHAKIGALIQRKGLEYLLRFSNKPLTPINALQFIKQGIRIEREAILMGLSTTTSTPSSPALKSYIHRVKKDIEEESKK